MCAPCAGYQQLDTTSCIEHLSWRMLHPYVWNIISLENVNRCGVWFVTGHSQKHASLSVTMKQRTWITLKDCRHVNDLCQMHKVSHNNLNITFDHILNPLPHCTHSNNQAYINKFQPTCDATRNAFFAQTIPHGMGYPLHLLTSLTPKHLIKKWQHISSTTPTCEHYLPSPHSSKQHDQWNCYSQRCRTSLSIHLWTFRKISRIGKFGGGILCFLQISILWMHGWIQSHDIGEKRD